MTLNIIFFAIFSFFILLGSYIWGILFISSLIAIIRGKYIFIINKAIFPIRSDRAISTVSGNSARLIGTISLVFSFVLLYLLFEASVNLINSNFLLPILIFGSFGVLFYLKNYSDFNKIKYKEKTLSLHSLHKRKKKPKHKK